MNNISQEVELQRQYYVRTSEEYDKIHLSQDWEHELALHLLAGYIEFYQIRSVLDVGAGTGRTVIWLKNRFPELKIIGIEPVAELRQQGYKKGLSPEDLLDGDAYQLSFSDNSFDLVCEFAVLHHLKQPERAINEMNRVAAKMICISDSNFMGQGSLHVRLLKYLIFSFGFWPVANWIKTKGKGYTISEEDGLAYSYSVYQSLPTIRQAFRKLRLMTTNDHYVKNSFHFGQILTASNVFLIGLDKKTL